MAKPTLRCPYCSKTIHPSKGGFVASHLTAGGLRCIAIGLSWRSATHLSIMQKQFRKMK